MWLILSGDDHGREVPAVAKDADVIVVAEPALFLQYLAELHPRVVVCAEPPADRAVLEVVSRDRRRRAGMRAVHLAPPDAVTRRLEALGLGFDDALATTVPAVELAGRLAWLDTRDEAARELGSRLQVTSDLVLDREAHALRRAGVPVHLRPKEYALLAVLAANPGRVMTRQELLQVVWGPDRAADSRTVDVHVRWLRAKIEPDPDRAVHLVTVRRVGYRFDPPH